MADALCGPSNALQNFQKHASVDRSLQQDRLAFRQSPSQSFRSSPAPGASHIDAEFHAFQAGQPLLGDQFSLNARHVAPLIQPPQATLPGWASDFQQLRLSDAKPIAPSAVRFQPAGSRAGIGGGWQNEFLRQQQTSTGPRLEAEQPFSQSMWQQPMPTFSPLASSSLYNAPLQQNQDIHAVGQEPLFDEAAFAKAFEDIQTEIDESESKGKERATQREPVVKFDLSHASMEMGDVTGSYDYAVPLETELLSMRREVGWEALDAYQRAHDIEYQSTGSQESLNISNTIKQMRTDEERSSQSQTPEPQMETVRIGADTIPESQQQAEPGSSEAEADELAKTAGQLIESLKDEQSTKFQQSNFMELMRQLRDKEVRVDGENMVPVGGPDSSPNEPTSGGSAAEKQAPHPGGRYYPFDAFASDESHVGR